MTTIEAVPPRAVGDTAALRADRVAGLGERH
jgi:hypothetical protein